MKQATSKIQLEYLAAKALVLAMDEEEKRMGQAYISAHGIVNPDGTIPERITDIIDDAVFDKACEEVGADMAACGFDAEYKAADSALKTAEDRLVEYGISLAPTGIRGALAHGAKSNYSIRQKLIDLVLHLDVSTIPR